MSVKVGINGYGTIGKRIADAVKLQDDMELVGVTLTKPSFKAEVALKNGFALYSAFPGGQKTFQDAGLNVSGDINDLLDRADVIVDCSPGKTGAENKKLYVEKGKKAVFQGGEKADVADVSFNAQANFNKAVGKQFVRVVSCNTTGLCRTLGVLKERFGVKEAYAVLVRRAADPWDSKKGPINAIVPENKVPSHHGPDVQTVIPDLKIMTAAVKVPTTIMHLHIVRAELERPASREDVLELFRNTSRVKVVKEGMGLKSTAEVMEWAKELGRKRADLFEIVVWDESVNVQNGTLYYIQAVHQESDVVPENIDAIRAMFGLTSKEESIAKTNKSLGIV